MSFFSISPLCYREKYFRGNDLCCTFVALNVNEELARCSFWHIRMNIMVELTFMKKLYLSAILALSVLAVSAQSHDRRNDGRERSVYNHEVRGRAHDYSPRGKWANSEQVKAIVRLMNETSFDENKLEVAKVCLMLRDVPVEGIRKMVKTLSFSDNKKDLLKFAYKYCPDHENYYTLCKELSFSSDREELLRYMEKH